MCAPAYKEMQGRSTTVTAGIGVVAVEICIMSQLPLKEWVDGWVGKKERKKSEGNLLLKRIYCGPDRGLMAALLGGEKKERNRCCETARPRRYLHIYVCVCVYVHVCV